MGCLTVLATGVAPALAQSRRDLSRAGRRETASDTPTPSATRLVDGLVAGQAALAVAVMRPVLRAMLVGVVVGLFGAAMQGLRAWMFGVAPTDPLTWTGAVVVVLLAGGIAAYLPARSVMRIDPMVVLRE